MNMLALIPLFLQYGTIIESAWQASTSNEDFIARLKTAVPGDVLTVALQIAQSFFPGMQGTNQTLAGVLGVFNPTLIKYAQTACNLILNLSPPLVVDGIYGPKTEAAIKSLQQNLGVSVDGLFGKVTEAAVKKLNIAGL
jgi:peptidoglycan hydrolase-like protein with peptidoglycan-binding domain